jgi:hypothetical protein
MRSIAWLFAGAVLLVHATSPSALAEGTRAQPRAQGANTGNSSRGGRKEFGFFLEPSVGYGYGKYSGDTSGQVASTASTTLTGPALSAQLGAVYTSYFAAIRLNYELLSGSGLKGIKDFTLGIAAGRTLSSTPLRFYGAFNFIDNMNNGAGRTLSANSFILGLGYFISSTFVLNLEYHLRDFSHVTIASTSIQPSYSNFVLTLSLPLMFSTPSMPDMAKQSADDLKEVGASMGEWNI